MKYKCKKGGCDEIDENICCTICDIVDGCHSACGRAKREGIKYSIIDGINKNSCKNAEEVESNV